MLAKDIHPDNLNRHASEDAAADAGNTAVARAVIGRYTGGSIPGRTVSFVHRTVHPALAGEKCLSLAGDLTQRWKWGTGSTILSGRPLPFLRRVFSAGAESSVAGQGFSAAEPMPQPKARAVIPPQPGGTAVRPQLQGKAASSGGNPPGPAAPDTAGANEQPVQKMIPGVAAGRQPGQKEQTASTSAVKQHSRAGSGTGLEGKHIAGKNPEQGTFAAGPAPAIAEPAVEANMADMSIRITERHDPPFLARKYRRTSDGFDFLREKSELSRNIAASYRQASHDTASVRLKTAANRRSMNSALQGNSHTPPENRVSRQAARINGTAGNPGDSQPNKVQLVGKKGDKDVQTESLPSNGSSGPLKLQTASSLTGEPGKYTPFTGVRPAPPKKGTDAAAIMSFPVAGFQLSGNDLGEAAGRNLPGTVTFPRTAGSSSGLPLLRSAVMKTAATATEPSGTGTSPGGIEPAGTSGLQPVKARINPSQADRSDGGAAAPLWTSGGFISRAAKSAGEDVSRRDTGERSTLSTPRSGTAYGADLFQPLTLRGNAVIMRKIFRHRSEAPFSSDIAGVQLMRNDRLTGFRASAGERQGTMYSGADSTVRGSGPPGHSGLTFFAGRPMDESADAGAGLSSGKPFGSRETMPMLNRKSSAGSEGRGSVNGAAAAGSAERSGLSGFLQRSAMQNGATGTTPEAATVAAQATAPYQAAAAANANSAPVDLERIADEVYRIIERRLIVEKERKGL